MSASSLISVRFKDLSTQRDVVAAIDMDDLPDPLLKDKLQSTLDAGEEFTLSEHLNDASRGIEPGRLHVGGFPEIEHALRRPTGQSPALTVWLDEVVPSYFPRPRGPRM